MHSFNEELLHFVWRHRLLKPGPYRSHAGNEIEVIRVGELNTDAGPDFFNGQVKVNGIVLSGNIEIHIRTSDWLKHGHQNDAAYDHLILHVVFEHDVALPQNLANQVEVLEIRSLVDEAVLKKYSALSEAPEKLPCSASLQNVPDAEFLAWTEQMTKARLEEKSDRIASLVKLCKGDLHQAFYSLLLRNFGFMVNALPFELLARQLPVQLLLKRSDNLLQVESLLFGCAGMLDEQFGDKYMRSLQNEFEFLRKKYGLMPLKKELFKFSRMRPANFPSLRLAQFAMAVHRNQHLFSMPAQAQTAAGISQMLGFAPGEYWQRHYRADGRQQARSLALGATSVENIVINSFAPFYYFYSKYTGKPEFALLARQLLQECAAEDNSRARLFMNRKSLIKTAADTQALVYLYQHLCTGKKCLDCGIGTALIASN